MFRAVVNEELVSFKILPVNCIFHKHIVVSLIRFTYWVLWSSQHAYMQDLLGMTLANRITFIKKLKADSAKECLLPFSLVSFCLLICHQDTRIKVHKWWFYLLLCIDVQPDIFDRELHILYSTHTQTHMLWWNHDGWDGWVVYSIHEILVRKPEVNNSLGVDGKLLLKMVVEETVWRGEHFIHLTHSWDW